MINHELGKNESNLRLSKSMKIAVLVRRGATHNRPDTATVGIFEHNQSLVRLVVAPQWSELLSSNNGIMAFTYSKHPRIVRDGHLGGRGHVLDNEAAELAFDLTSGDGHLGDITPGSRSVESEPSVPVDGDKGLGHRGAEDTSRVACGGECPSGSKCNS